MNQEEPNRETRGRTKSLLRAKKAVKEAVHSSHSHAFDRDSEDAKIIRSIYEYCTFLMQQVRP